MTNVLIFFLGFVVAIAVGQFFKVNPGFVAILIGFLLNWIVLGAQSKAFIALWPTTLFWNCVMPMTFYSFANANGTMAVFGKNIVYTFRHAKWAITIVIFLATALITATGAGLSSSLIMAPLAWELCMQAGVSPLLIPFSTWAGSLTMGFAAWTSNGSMFSGYFAQYFPEVDSSSLLFRITVYHILFFVLAFAVMFVINKGWKVAENDATMDKPEAFNSEQKRTLTVISICIAVLLIPSIIGQFAPNPVFKWMKGNLTMPVTASIGISILCITHCGNLRDICAKKVGWNAVWTIAGMAMYCGLAKELGVIESLGTWLESLPAFVIAPAICFVAAALSFVVSASAVQPFLFAMVPALATAAGCSIPAMVVPMLIGCAVTSFSPFSSGGVQNLIGSTQEVQTQLINKMIITAIGMAAAACLLSALGVFAIGA
ncbi:MAG: hypothetical protein KH366_22240 [Clostridiaceae bacterium]|nr:hypothetical protein [Clostridiaceae bacterium]